MAQLFRLTVVFFYIPQDRAEGAGFTGYRVKGL